MHTMRLKKSALLPTTSTMRLPSTNRLNNSRRSTAALTLAEADQLTVHVIGIRVKGYTWMGEQSLLDTECLAEQNGGLYIGVESEDDLAKALERTLGCPMLSESALP